MEITRNDSREFPRTSPKGRLRSDGGARARSGDGASGTESFVNILVVDDHPENRLALRAVLTAPDYRLVEAASGAEALRCLLREDFALVLLDVVMPGMDGFEVAQIIKQRDRTSALPIIFLSAEAADLEGIYRGYSAGAVDYLVKPLSPDVVRAKVAVFADLHRQKQEIQRQAELLRQGERRQRDIEVAELMLASQRRYRSLAEAIPQIVWTARADGAVDYFNQRWFEFTGLSVAQAGGSWAGALHPDDAALATAEWERARRDSEMYECECRLRRGDDGTFHWHLCRAVPERGAGGEVVGWLGTFTDIDEQKRHHAVLSEFKASLDAVADAVWIAEPETWRFLYVNQGACALLGRSAEELSALALLDVLPMFESATFRELVAPLRDGTTTAITLETLCRHRDEHAIPIELSLQFIPVEGGRFVSIARDVTERKKAEDERARLYHEAREAVRLRDEFLSIASHELNTPLTSLRLHIEGTLRRAERDASAGPLPDWIDEKLRAGTRQIDRLARLVNELLDVSRITTERLTLERDDTDLAAVVTDVAARLCEQARKAGSELSIDAPGPVVGRWDRSRLEQVATNLVSNAIKYGARRPIEVRVERDERVARLVVRDHGIGIAPDDQARIFERFERAVSVRHYGGLGLGLYIARQIVAAHGGTIHVESAAGEGSTFTVELPIGAPAAETR